jgi:amino acid transporter
MKYPWVSHANIQLTLENDRRGLSQRHIQMIALAGTIGTVSLLIVYVHTEVIDRRQGLFLSSGKAIARGGPLGAL